MIYDWAMEKYTHLFGPKLHKTNLNRTGIVIVQNHYNVYFVSIPILY